MGKSNNKISRKVVKKATKIAKFRDIWNNIGTLDTWKCPVCLVLNPTSAAKCEACESSRPGVAQRTTSIGNGAVVIPAAKAFVNAAGGFIFGGAPTANSSLGSNGFVFGGETPTATFAVTKVQRSAELPIRRRSARLKSNRAEDRVAVHTGQNMANQSGLGSRIRDATDENHPPGLNKKFGKDVEDIASSASATAVLVGNGRVYLVGDASTGGRGNIPSTQEQKIMQLLLDGEHKFQQIEAGDTFFLLLTETGILFFCGHFHDTDNNKSFKFPPPLISRSVDRLQGVNLTPVKIKHPYGGKWKLIKAGETSAAVIDARGKIFSFGLAHPCTLARRIGDYGDQSSLSDIIGESFNTGVVDAIGNPVWGYRYFPDPICELLQPGKMHFADSLNGVVKDVAVGGFHMLVVVSKKSSTGTSVYTCGRNDCGQLGLGDKTTREILTKIEAFDGMNIHKVAAGTHHSLALDHSGSVWVCGRNSDGQTGLPSNNQDVLKPRLLEFPQDVKIIDISAKGHVSMAIAENGNLYSWGAGPTGHASDEPITSPRLVNVTDEYHNKYIITKVAPGVSHSLFITKGA